MKKLSNGTELYDLCYGSAIVDTYRYTMTSGLAEKSYRVKTFLKNQTQYRKDRALPRAVKTAYDHGLRMYDTSRAYGGSEYVIGKSLKGRERSSFVVVTKLCNTDQYRGDVRAALEKSLSELRMDYIDLYLMHWPVPEHYVDSWRQMEALYEEGLCKAIGVCNFSIHHLEDLRKNTDIMPMVNQFECHPLFTQKELRDYCNQNGIQVMAYTSTARNDDRLRNTILAEVAQDKGKSVTQVILRWHQQVGNIPIVNSSNPKHILENIDIQDFSLTDDEIRAVEEININSRLRYDPDNCDFRKI